MQTTMNSRAAKGGQTGMNGEFYAGGTFLPNTTLGKMARGSRRTTGRRFCVAPFEWTTAPSEGLVSLFEKFRDFVDVRTGIVNEQACRYYNRNPEEMVEMFMLWANGERWMLA